MNLQTLKTLLIDGDGVLWRANEPVPGLNRFFDVLEQRGIKWALLTNNATRSIEQYMEKLNHLGIAVEREQIHTSGTVTAAYLQEHIAPGSIVYVVGASGLQHFVQEAGFQMFTGSDNPGRADAVAVGLDRDINYEKLTIGTRLIRSGAAFIGTNPDTTFPTPEGLAPGAGSLLAALRASTGIEPTVIGKPQRAIYEAAMTHLKGDVENTAMLGDRLETDILGAKALDLGTMLVFSGVTSREQLENSDIQPDVTFESIAEVAEALDAHDR